MDYNDQADAEDRDYCTDKFLDEMEELREDNAALRAEVARLREALADAIPWIGEPSEGPSWATDEAKSKNRRMCGAALEAACNAMQPLPAPPAKEE